MLPINTRIYDPDALKMMTGALDQAYRYLPADLKENERVRTRLAFLVILHVDDGERDPSRISDAIVTECLSWSGSSLHG
jgi:hypothetical protein